MCRLPSLKFGIMLLVIVTIFRVDFANADSALPPNSTVFVRIRGSAAYLLLKRLKAAAEMNGLNCSLLSGRDPLSLRCQFFDGLLYNAIITTTDETGSLLRIDLHYEDDSSHVDETRQAKMLGVLRQFGKDVQRSRNVRAITQCAMPVQVTGEGCVGRSLWRHSVRPPRPASLN